MEKGIVEKILNENTVLISVEGMEGCESCDGKSCGNIFYKKNKNTFEVNYNGDINVGDRVEILFKPELKIIAAIILFILPIAGLVVFYYLGNALFNKESLSILSSLVGLIASFMIAYIIGKKSKKMNNFKPFVEKIANNLDLKIR